MRDNVEEELDFAGLLLNVEDDEEVHQRIHAYLSSIPKGDRVAALARLVTLMGQFTRAVMRRADELGVDVLENLGEHHARQRFDDITRGLDDDPTGFRRTTP